MGSTVKTLGITRDGTHWGQEIPLRTLKSHPTNSNIQEAPECAAWVFRERRSKFNIFGHLMRRTHSFEKTLMLGKIEVWSRRGQQRMRWLDGITNSVVMNLRRLPKVVKHMEAWYAVVHGVTKSWTRLSNWTATTYVLHIHIWMYR